MSHVGRVAALLMAGLALAGAQTARAGCIDEPVTNAARLHEFESLMMEPEFQLICIPKQKFLLLKLL